MTHPPTPNPDGTYPPPPDPPVQPYQPSGTEAYQPPAASGYQPPPAPGYQPPGYQPPPAAGYQPPGTPGYQPSAADAYPPAGTPYQPPAIQAYQPPAKQPYPPAQDPFAPPAAYGPPPQPYDYGYSGSPYGYQQGPRPTEGLAVASLVVSCASIAGLCGWWIGGLLGILGAIFGHVARKRIRASGAGGAGMALAGIIIGWIVTGIALIGGVALAIAISMDSSTNTF